MTKLRFFIKSLYDFGLSYRIIEPSLQKTVSICNRLFMYKKEENYLDKMHKFKTQ